MDPPNQIPLRVVPQDAQPTPTPLPVFPNSPRSLDWNTRDKPPNLERHGFHDDSDSDLDNADSSSRSSSNSATSSNSSRQEGARRAASPLLSGLMSFGLSSDRSSPGADGAASPMSRASSARSRGRPGSPPGRPRLSSADDEKHHHFALHDAHEVFDSWRDTGDHMSIFSGHSMVCVDISTADLFSGMSAARRGQVHIVNMVSLRWLRHPFVISFWSLTLACRFLETRENTFRPDADGHEQARYCLFDGLGDIPSWWVAVWVASSIGDFRMWPGLLLILVLFVLRTADCMDIAGNYGLVSGLVVPIMFLVVVSFFSTLAKPERKKFLRAFGTIGCLSVGGLISWGHFQGCLIAYMPNRVCFAALRSVVPTLYEVSCRKSIGWCWRRWSGTTPHTIFMAVTCTHAVNAQMLQMANFLHCAEYPDPISSSLRLSVLCVFFDVMARTKTFQILIQAFFGWPFVLDDAADLALRARWVYVYALFPFVFSFALLALNYVIVVVLFIYLITELVCDLVVLTFQYVEHRRRGHHLTVSEIWQQVKEPFGHIFPLGRHSRHLNDGFAMSTQFRPEAPMPPWFCIDAKAMVGLGLVSFPSNVIYRCLEGSFMRRVCY